MCGFIYIKTFILGFRCVYKHIQTMYVCVCVCLSSVWRRVTYGGRGLNNMTFLVVFVCVLVWVRNSTKKIIITSSIDFNYVVRGVCRVNRTAKSGGRHVSTWRCRTRKAHKVRSGLPALASAGTPVVVGQPPDQDDIRMCVYVHLHWLCPHLTTYVYWVCRLYTNIKQNERKIWVAY